MKYPWMPLFWGDFLANTMHLSAQEAGAYLFLIGHAWEHEGEIPGGRRRLARIAHVRHDRWNEVWDVLQHFFEPIEAGGPMMTGPHDDGTPCFYHARVKEELQRLGKISNKRKVAAVQKHSKSTAKAQQMEPGKAASAHASTSTSNKESSNGKEGEVPSLQKHGDFRDKGVDYRSPPPNKPNSELAPDRNDVRALVAKAGAK